MHDIEIRQITSESGNSYFNVVHNEYGKIEVWGCIDEFQPMYLVQDGIRFHLIIFDNPLYADEWLDKFEGAYEKIQKINPLT